MRVPVSVIIINYNSFQYTYDCVVSLLEKTAPGICEIIVVDNASQHFDSAKLKSLSPGIKIILNKENVGFARGNNIGIRHSEGDIILLLNNDTFLLNDAITMSYKCLVADDAIGVVGCKLWNKDKTWQRSFYAFPSIRSVARRLLRQKEQMPDASGGQYVDWVTGAFFMFRRSDLKLFPEGKLQEDFFMYCEDIQWCWQFKKNNRKMAYCPEGEVVHYHGKSSVGSGDFEKKMKHYFPNLKKLLVIEKSAVYAMIYYILLALVYLSDRKDRDRFDKFKKLLSLAFVRK